MRCVSMAGVSWLAESRPVCCAGGQATLVEDLGDLTADVFVE
jgi:hypothetical protein